MFKKKVLIVQEVIPEYRTAVFNKLSEFYDLTVIFSKGTAPKNIIFKVKKIPTISFFGKLFVHRTNLLSVFRRFDVVILMLDFSFLFSRLATVVNRKYKLLFWGIGVSAAYNSRYDSNINMRLTFKKYINKADGCIFYSDYPKTKYIEMGINSNKLFVAPNTVEVLYSKAQPEKKDILLFIGSLYRQKRVDLLINSYYKARLKNINIPKLIIIGDGEEMDNLKKLVTSYDIEEYISFVGQINDEKQLSKYFSRSLACISPDQAGLSVLKSMGYGVPFITNKNAITGGEIFNIVNNENGLLFDSFSELTEILIDITNNTSKYIQMGDKAFNYYKNSRTVDHMVTGFISAIDS